MSSFVIDSCIQGQQCAPKGLAMGVPEKPSGGCGKLLLIGCGGLSVLLVIVAALIYLYWPTMAAMGIRIHSDGILEQSAIDESVKEGFRVQRDRVLTEFENETVESAMLIEELEKLQNTAIVPAYIAMVLDADILPQSTLNDQQKDDLKLQMNRVVRGFAEGILQGNDLQGIIQPLVNYNSVTAVDGNADELIRVLDDDALVQVSADLKELVDGKKISVEHFDFDVTSALEKFVDQVLNENSL